MKQTKTPRQRAEEKDAKAALDYANANPALKAEVSTPTGAGTVTTSVGGGAS